MAAASATGIDLKSFESKLLDFYAPAAEVRVNGEDLVRKLGLEVASVQVDDALTGADHWSVALNDGFDPAQKKFRYLLDFFRLGAPVEIRMGYRDVKSQTPLLMGLVTAVSTSFPSSGLPQLTVSGFDLSYRMMRGKRSFKWPKARDSDVATELAGDYQLTPKVESSEVYHPKVEQSQESDFDLLMRLAERSAFEFYVREETLYFVPPASNKPAVLKLEWGRGLVAFTPEVNIAEQVTRVEVIGWDPRRKREIVGKAGKQDEPGRDPGRRSGAEVARDVFGDEAVLRVRRPVYSQQDADQRADAILRQRAERYVTGSGESIGIPELRAGCNVELAGLGADFDKTYYVEQATHTLSSAGYRTSFRVKETTV